MNKPKNDQNAFCVGADIAFDIVIACNGSAAPVELLARAKTIIRQAKNREITNGEAMHLLITMDLKIEA